MSTRNPRPVLLAALTLFAIAGIGEACTHHDPVADCRAHYTAQHDADAARECAAGLAASQ